jgi:hypothetical protein
MAKADYAVRETDPFDDRSALALPMREASPYVNRIRLLWQKMREPVIERFPKAPGLPRNAVQEIHPEQAGIGRWTRIPKRNDQGRHHAIKAARIPSRDLRPGTGRLGGGKGGPRSD